MSDLTLEELRPGADRRRACHAPRPRARPPPDFTRRALDDLEQAGVTENTFAAYYRAHGLEASGYGSNESLDTLDLFVTDFRQDPQVKRWQDGVETLFRRVLNFVQRCGDGLRQQIDESVDVYDMCLGVEKKLQEASRLRLFLLTNSDASVTALPEAALEGLPVSYEIWDLTSLHRMATSGTLSEPIAVEFNEPLPCLATPVAPGQDFSVFLAHPAGHRACRPVRPVRHPAAGAERPFVPPDQGRGQPRHPRHAADRARAVPRVQQRHHRDRFGGRLLHSSRRWAGHPAYP